MERLTWRSSIDGYEDVALKDGVSTGDAIYQLADYEDTGLSPETVSDLLDRFTYFYRTAEGLDIIDPVHFGAFVDRVKRWQQAEKDGRLMMLPCKVGDLLYEIDSPKYGVITCKVLEIHIYFGPLGHAKGNPMVLTATVSVEVIDGHGEGSGYTFEALDFGENVFLTREEAEAALKKREDGENEAVR